MSQFIEDEDDSFHYFVDEDGELAVITEDGTIIRETYEDLEDQTPATEPMERPLRGRKRGDKNAAKKAAK